MSAATDPNMKIEVRTRMRIARGGVPTVVLDLLLLPRGSGNRNRARRLAQAFREHPKMKRHVRRVVCGTSRVTVHLRASVPMMRDIWAIAPEQGIPDVPGQMPLFAR